MDARAITDVRLEDGTWVPLTELPCNHCGKPGSPYLALSEQGTWAFCSFECRRDAMRIDGKEPTEETMKAAGLHFIGPRPDA